MGAQDQVATMLLERARENHLAGRLVEAEPLYRHSLRLMPDNAETLHMLGVLLMQAGQFAPAAELIAKAVELKPDISHYLGSLGAALRQSGRHEEALACFSRAVTLRPDFADGFCKIGMILQTLGRPMEAVDAYREALRQAPDLYDAHNNLGNTLRDLDRPREAHIHYAEALRLRPEAPEAHNNMGNLLAQIGRPEEAEEHYHEALRLNPDSGEARFNLGLLFRRGGRPELAEEQLREVLHGRPDHPRALRELGDLLDDAERYIEAEPVMRRLVEVTPADPRARRRLGGILARLGAFAEAETHLREALRGLPDDLQAAGHMAVVMTGLGRFEEAEACCGIVLRQRPDEPHAHYNLSLALLARGRYAEGWGEWEWRWQVPGMMKRTFPQPMWTGEEMGDGVLLLHAEQGLGDTLQFCRYVPMAARRARIVLEVPAGLVRLMSRLPGVETVVATGGAIPSFDRHCSLMSLPRLFGTTMETIPASIPYLRADPARVAPWRERLAGVPGLKVGLVWSGNPRHLTDARRSMKLTQLAGLARVPEVVFVSLQKGEAAEQAKHPPTGLTLIDWTDELRDSADTAALIEALDMVIAVDTSVVHLAGALGKRVWMMNRYDSDWRWLRNRDDSPWYPTLRQFRQPKPGDWDSVVTAVRGALIDDFCGHLLGRISL